jgi:hypothetical protein
MRKFKSLILAVGAFALVACLGTATALAVEGDGADAGAGSGAAAGVAASANDGEGANDNIAADASADTGTRLTTLDANTYTVTASTTGGGSVSVTAGNAGGTSVSVQAGTQVVISPKLPSGSYLAQVRYAVETVAGEGSDAADEDTSEATGEGAGDASTQTTYGTYTAITPNENGQYAFTMPAGNVNVMVDYISIVWDGTIDVTWYNTESKVFHLQYPAQYAGLAAIVDGLFTAYPTKIVIEDEETGASHEAPDYTAYQKIMGVVFENEVAVGSNLYGEFASTYRLTDSQTEEFAAAYAGTSDTSPLNLPRTDDISVVQRLVGDASYVVANVSDSNDSSGPNGQNLTTSSAYWFGSDDFDGKVVYIESDLDFGATKNAYGIWNTSSPLFMPVGGQYCMLPGLEKTNGYSKLSASWNGTLDGKGHSFTNVYCERYASGGNFGDSQSVGIVGRLGIHDGDYATYKSSDGTDGNYPAVNPTVRQIVLESGYISGRRSTGGIVGKIGQTSSTNLKDGTTGGIVEYCINKATVVGTDKKGIGGIVGSAWNNGRISNCANFGKVSVLTYGSGWLAGGIAGSCEVTFSNCYNVGTVFAGMEGSSYAEAIGTDNAGTIWNNCYYLLGSDGNTSSPGVYKGTGTDTVYSFGSSKANYKTLTASMLNASGESLWQDDTTGINSYDGVNYPVLYYQADGFDPDKEYSITVENPEVGGTFTASATSATYATVITLENTPISGYALDHYVVNGEAITGNSFILEEDTTVTAVFRKLTSATITLTNSDEFDYTLSATKTGVIFKDGYTVYVNDYPVVSGDTVYEGDVITYNASIKEGAAPEDVNKYYTGEFSYKTTGSSTTFKESYTVTSADTTLTAQVSTAKSTYKNWATLADTSWYIKDHVQSSYTISTPEQLAGLAVLVNDGETFEGTTFTLGNDISLANTDGTTGVRNWTPIGYDTNTPFKGTFDGCGHKITNMTIEQTVSECISQLRGLFGNINGSTVKNITVSGAITGATSNICGGVVASATGACQITNCTSYVDITSEGITTGGIVGSLTGPSESSSDGTADAGNTSGGAESALITGCKVDATISSDGASNSGVGGIAGNASNTTVTNCHVKGSVQSNAGSNNNVGGIVGKGSAVKITGCVNAAGISSTVDTSYLGGIVGYVNATSKDKISYVSSCLNQGTISGCAFYAAGIAGNIEGGCTIENCASVANISSSNTKAYAACMAGRVNNSAKTTDTTLALVINNCYAAGSLDATSTAYLVGLYQSGVITTTNDYYESGIALKAYAKKGSASGARSNPTATSKSTDELKALAPTLGKAWSDDALGLNSRYPVPVASQNALVLGIAAADVNMNGVVNIVDALVAYDIANGKYTEYENYQAMYALAEVNGDGVVDACDAFAIQYSVTYGCDL